MQQAREIQAQWVLVERVLDSRFKKPTAHNPQVDGLCRVGVLSCCRVVMSTWSSGVVWITMKYPGRKRRTSNNSAP